jgi:digeranylgeranylglycerophospholipid reductase
MRDVAIVGGGPGGLHAAALLARAGLDVVVYEEHASSGTPVHCTGVLAADAFDEFGLDRSSILNPLTTARFFSPGAQSIEYTPARVEAVAVDRLVFDQRLFDRAREAGASIALGRRVDDVSADGRAARLRFKDGSDASAKVVVLACGANYVLQRRLGLGMPAMYLQSAQLEVPAGRIGNVEVHFGRDVAPNGFAWVVPVHRGDRWFARVGLMCERDSASCFQRFFDRVSRRWQLDGGGDREPRQKLLPLAPIPRTSMTRLLAIGDAAGIVKATTGGGIYYSVLTASLAATTLLRAFRVNVFDGATLARYDRAWQRRLGAEIRAQQQLRVLAHQLGDRDIEAFFDLARTDGVMPIVRKTARFNQHRSLILALLRHPPARRILLGRIAGQRPGSRDAQLDHHTT